MTNHGARARRAAAHVVPAVLLLAGCARDTYLPPSPRAVRVEMREYAFDSPGVLPPGRAVVRAHNAGRLPHELVMVILPEDLPPVSQLFREEPRTLRNLAVMPAHPPGATGTFAVDFPPGRYGIICFVTDPDGQPHAKKGMATEFRVR